MELFAQIPIQFHVAYVIFIGLCIGSFANVCIYRMPLKESLVFPGSHCPSCNSPVKIYDNIPVIGYLLLKGKCRNCKTRISVIYPLVEVLTAILMTGVFLKFGFTWEGLAYLIVAPALVVITAIDLEHQIIPDQLTLPGIVLGLAAGSYIMGPVDSIIGFLVGGGLFYGIAELCPLVFGKEGMGGGDIKYIAGVGALLGWKSVLLVIFVGSFLGAVIGLALMLIWKKGSKIPFGPYLAAATYIVIMAGDELIRLYIQLVV